ncbi:MAG: hypothetical protein FWE54_00295 [Methanimicrococcus sp.]|nr:hypothetical protein [Methanimicrococcus sp.]
MTQNETFKQPKQTKIVVIGGFLGTGKTTAIKELGRMFSAAGKTVTYFTNEVGEVVLDGDLMNYDIETKEVTMACVTCNIKEAMTAVIDRLITQISPDILFIEPKETMSPLVVQDGLSKHFIRYKDGTIVFAPLFTLIDCSRFFSNIKEKKRITFDQISVSEVIVLNKTDLVKPNELKMISESIKQINPASIILENTCENEDGLKKMLELINR